MLCSCEGGEAVLKLTDFGLAKDDHLSSTIQMRTNVGSPSFMAPEIYELQPYTDAVDVFALGLVCLGLLLHKETDQFIMPCSGSILLHLHLRVGLIR